jgi:hypothetical protein
MLFFQENRRGCAPTDYIIYIKDAKVLQRGQLTIKRQRRHLIVLQYSYFADSLIVLQYSFFADSCTSLIRWCERASSLVVRAPEEHTPLWERIK